MIERLIKIIVNSPAANDSKKILTVYNPMDEVFGQVNSKTEALAHIPHTQIPCIQNNAYYEALKISPHRCETLKNGFYMVKDYV